jgi:hypothetical protein
MVNMDHLEHALGIVSLAVFAGAGIAGTATIARTIVPNGHRILAALRGEPISPAASDAPHASAPLPQRRGVEAADAPASALTRVGAGL